MFYLSSKVTWVIIVELALVMIAMSIVVSITVERSRKCWDYCFTLLFLHLVLTMVSHVCSVALSQVGVPDQADVVVCFWICYVVVADDLGASLSAKRDGGYSGGGVVTVFGCLY